MKTEEEVIAQNKKLFKKIGIVILAFIAAIVVLSSFGSGKTANNNKNTRKQTSKVSLVEQVNKSLKEFGDSSVLAATSPGGYQGKIETVEPDSNNGIKVKVSTYFKDPSTDGKNIANSIFGAVCLDVPELQSVYVTSTSSGLDSRSVYRSDIPGCKQ